MDREHTIHIEADIDTVWDVLMDVEHWTDWTPTMMWIRPYEDEPLQEGSVLHIKQPRLKAAAWTITSIEPKQSFTWRNSGAGVITEVDHELAATPDGTSVTLRVRQSGRMAGITGFVGGGAVKRNLQAEANGLKHRCETGRGRS